MRGLRVSLCLAALGGVLVALPAAASTSSAVERVAVTGPGVTSAFPKGIVIELHAPPGYTSGTTAGTAGTWIGPKYWATGNSSVGGRTSIEWRVRFVQSSRGLRAVAWAGLKMGLPYLRKDPIAVPQLVGGHVIGTIEGFMVLTQGKAPQDASYEGSLAFPVAPDAYARMGFVLDQPPSDSAGAAGQYLVNGQVAPSAWERGQVFWAFTGVRLVGKLPPRRVFVHGYGTQLHGRVHDYFKHPVPGAQLTLQRKSHSGWSTVLVTQANSRGRFRLTASAKGLYRVHASAAGSGATSRAVRLN